MFSKPVNQPGPIRSWRTRAVLKPPQRAQSSQSRVRDQDGPVRQTGRDGRLFWPTAFITVAQGNAQGTLVDDDTCWPKAMFIRPFRGLPRARSN